MDSNQQQILRYLAQLERQLIKAYGATYSAALEIAEVRKAIESGSTFSWSNNRAAAAKVDKLLKQLSDKVQTLIANGINASYRKGERSVEGQIIKALGIRQREQKKEVTAICDAATDKRREMGMTAAARWTARRGGIQASAAIWQQNAKKEIEVIVQNGITEGKSPKEIATDIRGYLLEPHRYEKSVYNPVTGKLERSEAARNYHPGQGIYRSSYKNALRMARTEMTAAYRAAEWESYQTNPLIKAYEIRLSSNHTTKKTVKGKSVVVPLEDICDKLAGVYPKSFKWTGWHPQCRCYMVPVTCGKSDFRQLLEARKADREAKQQGKEATAVKKLEQQAANRQLPKQFTKWLEDNQGRIDEARKTGGKIPMWITENADIPKQVVTPATEPIVTIATSVPQTLTPQQIAAQRHAARTQATIDAIIARWNQRIEKLEDASPLNEVVKVAKLNKVDYRDVKRLETKLTSDEIIARLGGGDKTKGSCSSLAFAYAGNRGGYNVLDFRGGSSCDVFSRGRNICDIARKVGGITAKNYNDYKNAAGLLSNVVEGKEYYFTCGRHAAIVRRNNGSLEFLELQSARENGWKPLDKNVLKYRFGAKQSHSTYGHKYETEECLIEISLLRKDYGYRRLLGYINTAEASQQKGSSGTIK